MTIDLVVNRESYEEIYPSESDDSDGLEDDLGNSESENEAMKIYSKETEKIQNLIKEATEEQASATSRLNILDQYGQSFGKYSDDLKASLNAYKKERKSIFKDYAASVAKIKDLKDDLSRLEKNNCHVEKAAEKHRKKTQKAKLRKFTKNERVRRETAQAKRRLKEERVYFWPKKVYRVVLSLDTNFDLTPSISRRGSLDSLAKPNLPSSSKADSSSIAKRSSTAQDSWQIGLAVSYITQCAWWSPRYDLSLITTTGSGTITCRAEFRNKTSESWGDAKVVLSISQTAFQDLGEAIPNMEPWHICLAKGFGQSIMDDALLSRSEMQSGRKGEATKSNKLQEPRSMLFGLVNDSSSYKIDRTWQAPAAEMAKKRSQVKLQAAGGRFGVPSHQTSGFGNSSSGSTLSASNSSSVFQQFALQRPQAASVVPSNDNGETIFDSEVPRPRGVAETNPFGSLNEANNTDTVIQNPAIEFEESNWEETGLTATYDVPGVRTIPPSQTTRRHKIASVALKNIQLSYVLVPKLREAAFLKARIHKNSSITLLKGPVGLTLDNSFLGNTTIPRCSAGDTFSLNLGVDPGITVTYQKPVVRRNQVGVFLKEGSCIFTRSLVVTNTKSNSVLEGVVLD